MCAITSNELDHCITKTEKYVFCILYYLASKVNIPIIKNTNGKVY